MAEQETYEGWANRETWAFWLHVTNDEGWYESVREFTADYLREPDTDDGVPDYELGEAVVEYVRDTLSDLLEDSLLAESFETRLKLQHQLNMMSREVGSWWRIDHAEIGAAARELAGEDQ